MGFPRRVCRLGRPGAYERSDRDVPLFTPGNRKAI